MNELSPTAFLIAAAVKVLAVFTALMVAIMYATWAERRLSAFIQDRLGPNRVGPFGLLQPIADGLKNIIKEETDPATASRFFFVLGPMLSIMPALVTFAVIPFAAPLPTPWGTVDMIVADLPVGVLYILAIGSLGVYGIFLGGWSSNNKYALLGGLRASAQMVSYEVGLGLSLIPVLMLAGNVTLTRMVADQQLGLWYILPLSLGFLLFLISAFAETNRLPFDMPEAESELVTGYHTEYSSMKFSMFFIAEYAHVITASALMATLFLGGWDIPFWSGDNFIPYEGGLISGFTAAGDPIPAQLSIWTTLLTLGAFMLKTTFFVVLYIWVRWTLPRFRYDQVMHLGWKVMLPTALAYVMLVGATILVLDQLGVSGGPGFALALTGVSLVATAMFALYLDRGRIITGAAPAGRAARPAPAAHP
ncbi:MAG: NADH-quinone oxidoreductase subunit NuoH [Gammaproteobacteria bacterium]|nr:NADH-quinone oxidoreductase subunit NuoH [Gammaproteobacteria bacterium]MDE0650252.1 NADH-quinone oxidoreductase subunit NuoH [Gammaproteobacteria bacterium]MXW10282.1 NADH-quinone oxidoreductase subunit NuoH [Gammaproteobacteria bacterium]MYC51038.1 NADH-quinone oxidoreductase subunit NuoH [Gammaproteobacteria bacterium]